MGQCQSSKPKNVVIQQNKPTCDGSANQSSCESLGVIARETLTMRPQSFVAMHAQVSSQHFHTGLVGGWKTQARPEEDMYESSSDDVAKKSDTSSTTTNDISEKSTSSLASAEPDKECCAASVISDFTSITQKVNQEKRQKRFSSRQELKDDKKFYKYLLDDFQEMRRSHVDVEDEDASVSVASSIASMPFLNDNSKWFIDFSNGKENQLHDLQKQLPPSSTTATPAPAALTEGEASSLDESILSNVLTDFSVSSSNSNGDLEKEKKEDTRIYSNYKVERRRRGRPLEERPLPPQSYKSYDHTNLPLPVITVSECTKSVSTCHSVSDTSPNYNINNNINNHDTNIMSFLQDYNEDEYEVCKMNDAKHPLDSDVDDDSVDSIPHNIQINIQ